MVNNGIHKKIKTTDTIGHRWKVWIQHNPKVKFIFTGELHNFESDAT